MLTPKRGDQFYIDGRTVLWCRCTGVAAAHISFEVINGCWFGKLDRTTRVITTELNTTYQADPIAWIGKAPFPLHHYNEAIQWIREQLQARS